MPSLEERNNGHQQTEEHKTRQERVECSRCRHLEYPSHIFTIRSARGSVHSLCRRCQGALMQLGLYNDR